MNYAPDCGDCPTPTACKAKDDCQVMRQLRHGHETRGGSGWDNVLNLPGELRPNRNGVDRKGEVQ